MRKQEAEDEYMREARNHRAAALTTRANNRASAEALKRTRIADADKVRKWEKAEWDADAAIRGLGVRRKQVAAQYATRYASEEDAQLVLDSPLKRIHDAARRAMAAAASAITGSPSSPDRRSV